MFVILQNISNGNEDEVDDESSNSDADSATSGGTSRFQGMAVAFIIMFTRFYM